MKRMKKLAAILLSASLVLGLLAGCGDGQKDPASGSPSPSGAQTAGEPGKTIRIGNISMGAANSPTFRAMKLAVDTATEAAGFEYIPAELSEYGDEAFLAAYESLVSQDVDGVLCYALSETVLPLLADIFVKNNVKYFLPNRAISNQEILDQLFADGMCVGNDHADEYQTAYDLTQYLAEECGVKNLAVIGLTKGDTNGDNRDRGIEQACTDFGVTLLTETRGIVTTDDVTNAVEGLIASYPELDGLFIVGGAVTTGALAGATQALTNHKLQDKVSIAMVDIATGMGEYMDEGPLKIVAGGNLIADYIFSTAILANELMGTPLSEEPIVLKTKMFYITSSAEAADYEKYIEGEVSPFTKEEYQQLLFKFTNPDVTLESVQELATNFSIESVKERHADLFQ